MGGHEELRVIMFQSMETVCEAGKSCVFIMVKKDRITIGNRLLQTRVLYIMRTHLPMTFVFSVQRS
jgi:hypothetical protein